MSETIDPKFLLSLTGLTPQMMDQAQKDRPQEVVAMPQGTRRGWTSAGLSTVGDDEKHWTVNEAVKLLGEPKLTPNQLRALIRAHNLTPCGKKRTTTQGTSGRHARVYKAEDLIRIHDQLTKK